MAIKLGQQETGSITYQVTEGSASKSNIYCEVPYASSDSQYFVFSRSNPDYSPNSTEYVRCKIGTWEMEVAGRGRGGVTMTYTGLFYFLRHTESGGVELVKVDLATGRSSVTGSFSKPLKARSLGTISPDGRYYAYGVVTDEKYREFGIELVDLHTNKKEIIDRDPYILNPHPQFEPSEGKQLMIQHNRGGKIDENGKLIKLVGDEGATLYLLDVDSGKRTELQVGKPYTTPATGHEAWIGDTKKMLLTVAASGDFAPAKGNLLGVKAGSPARIVSGGYWFNHVGTSVCGKFFACDDTRTADVVIGSVKTGKNALVCHSETSYGRAQNTHPHPYLTPDLKWVIYNSDRSGIPQIHVATVPEDMIGKLVQ
ncbi:hypothetical protein GF312_03090 [Candidatus Poribacteria bacterium]|nr:hypothetical protein [Candidatus Poribacteria bacterium]